MFPVLLVFRYLPRGAPGALLIAVLRIARTDEKDATANNITTHVIANNGTRPYGREDAMHHATTSAEQPTDMSTWSGAMRRSRVGG